MIQQDKSPAIQTIKTLNAFTWNFFQIGTIAKDTDNTFQWFIFLNNFKQR